jgi:hypothetical protein
VLESAPLERLGTLGIHPYPVATAWHIAPKLNVIARSDPGAADRQGDRLRFSQNPVTMGSLSQDFTKITGIEPTRHVVDHHDRRSIAQDRRDLLAPLLLFAWCRK